MNAPLRVPTRTRTPLMPRSLFFNYSPQFYSSGVYSPRYARFKPSISILVIRSMALKTLCDFTGSLVLDQFEQRLGDDLPRYAKFVFQPRALHFSSASGELLPQLIDFRLRLAVHKERYGWRKSVVRATVQRHEFLPFELESHSHHGSSRAGTRFSVTRNVQDF